MLTGKEIKAVSKGHTCVMIRFNGQHGIVLEGSTRAMGRKTETFSTVSDDEPSHAEGAYLDMYGMAHDSTWHYFQQSLRPTDEVVFVVRDNSNQFVKEAGMITEEVRARITRGPISSRKISHVFECTLKSITMGVDNCHRIKSV